MSLDRLPVGTKRPSIQALMDHVETLGGKCSEIVIMIDGVDIPHILFDPNGKGHGILCAVAGKPEDKLTQFMVQSVMRKIALF